MASKSALTVVLLACLCASTLYSTVSYGELPSKQEAQKELQQVKKRINTVKKAMRKQQAKLSKAQKALKKTEVSIGKINTKLHKVKVSRKQSETKIRELEAQNKVLQLAKANQQTVLAKDIKASFTQKRQEYIKLLLNQQNPEKFARMLRYYDYFHNARADRIIGYKNTLKEIEDIAVKMEAESLELERLNASLKKQKLQLAGKLKKRKKALKAVKLSLKSKDAKLKQLKGNQSQVEDLLIKIQKALDDIPTQLNKSAFHTRKGKLNWPTKGRLTHRFGSRRAQGKLKWQGVIIRAAAGNSVQAVHGGRVVFSDWLIGFGLLIIVDHGGGYLSLYGHNASLLKEPGEWVEGGETLATVGNSGGREEYGLYFEIRRKGKPTNPIRWMSKK
ncbi:MAG: peptidoglycan DD-metalloendopeptidase family protein [Pseudomonadales bacterium]|nr:peptidoglycan DD-metalloendopeptidase family protein [Pseudomonadales bacterium]